MTLSKKVVNMALCDIFYLPVEWDRKKYTWRHNQILKVFFTLLINKFDDFNEGQIPTKQVIKKQQFHQEGRRECIKKYQGKLNTDDRGNGSWMNTADIGSAHVSPILVINKQSDLVI